ncbi:patj [Culex quinquefasciatus]|uniref:Patj n=1 Tax=Culex quinquefasciatus TaxID=7176 RepID=B0XHR7_CULQU|nr:patj [Culex quinquefasciatus]|eukprot:XP_001869189.1 patj [Culex quinquefasciatus]
MHLSQDVSSALQQIEIIKQTVEELEPNSGTKLSVMEEDVKMIIDLLQDPVFRNIVQIQDSLAELNHQITQHPSILPGDFDIINSGELVLNVPPSDLFDPDYPDEQRVPSAQISPGSPAPPSLQSASTSKLVLLEQQQQHLPIVGQVATPQQLGLLQQQQQQLGGAPLKLTNELLDGSVLEHDSQDEFAMLGMDKAAGLVEPAEWSRILDIELVNDGTGLGFGIIGARATGVTVKTILAGGVADRDGRLQSGDQILQIGDVNLHEMVSEQVASVLRQSGTHVQLVVARPIDADNGTIEEFESSAIVPTVLLGNPLKLKQYLADSGYPEIFSVYSTANVEKESFDKDSPIEFPETEVFTVELKKDQNGLGITIAGYVCEKEELSGIFVKSVSPGSAADLSGKIQVNDRIIEVDGQSLHGFSNHQAVDVLKQSGHIVTLCLERYLRGPKYDQLQQAIAANEMKPPTPATPPPNLPGGADLSKYGNNILDIVPRNVDKRSPEAKLFNNFTEDDANAAALMMMAEPDQQLETMMAHKKLARAKDSIDTQEYREKIKEASIIPPPAEAELDLLLADATNQVAIAKHGKQRSSLKVNEDTEAFIVKKWTTLLGANVKIIVANIRKFAASSGLGISLEGTVDVEGGKEVRPHHYIRSILPEGPVGQNGLLRSGDELLEVNGQRLLGMNHLEVVSILKELPQDVCMVCGRGDQEMLQFTEESLINTLEEEISKSRGGTIGGGLQSSLTPSERLVKAKSDGSLATSGGAGDGFSKIKSRSLEPLTGLAMWSSEPQIIELVKGERGLGFSILDYQDPLDPNDTLIVIRSLVPGGVAQLDGRLIPGDRLLFVNDTILENSSLDQAVQALKGAPKGVVKIGVAKPLPMQDSSITSAVFEDKTTSSAAALAIGETVVSAGTSYESASRGSGKMLSMSKPDIIME